MGFHTGKHGKVYNDDKKSKGSSSNHPGNHDGSTNLVRESVDVHEEIKKETAKMPDWWYDPKQRESAEKALQEKINNTRNQKSVHVHQLKPYFAGWYCSTPNCTVKKYQRYEPSSNRYSKKLDSIRG